MDRWTAGKALGSGEVESAAGCMRSGGQRAVGCGGAGLGGVLLILSLEHSQTGRPWEPGRPDVDGHFALQVPAMYGSLGACARFQQDEGTALAYMPDVAGASLPLFLDAKREIPCLGRGGLGPG